MTSSGTGPRENEASRPDSFGPLVRSEWIKFRTVRSWLIGVGVAVFLSLAFTFLTANGSHEGGCLAQPAADAGPNSPGAECYVGHPFVPTGPSGEAVADAYYFVDRALSGSATVTARITSLTGLISSHTTNIAPSLNDTRPGLAGWSKAGILLTPSTTQGSAYAAVMATGSHGVRWQYNYTNDSAGLPGSVSAASPRWIRLTRDGDRLKGYDSANGERWTEIGSAYLPGLPLTVNVGLFVTSPVAFRGNNASPSKATATFDDISITSAEKSGVWRGQAIGTAPRDFYPTLGSGGFHRSGGTFVISGSGDIALGVGEGLLGTDTPGSVILIGIIASLLVMILLATVFITAEYRRGLIRTTFAVTPNRRRVLAAKTAVIGFVALVTGIIAATAAIPLGDHLLRANGNYVFPISTIAEMRIIFGSAALLSVTAMAVLGLGAIFRRSAGAVAGGLAVFILPSVAASFISGGAEQWLFCLTPAAGFAVLGGLPYSAQVSYSYNYANGYYPIAPWAGFLVVCAYAAVALGIATILVRRRDA